MPKKHAPAYTTTKPSYVHPALQSSRSSSSSTPAEPQSVNQRIAQLRREQAPRASIEQRNDMTLVVSSRTVPPDLRRILHIPEVNAPKPKVGMRVRMRRTGAARPPPGPAAPNSWLRASRYAPKQTPLHGRQRTGRRTSTRSCLARVTEKDFKRLPPPQSLQHFCLQTLADNWTFLSEYEQHYLPTLPIVMREALLSYLTNCSDPKCLTFKSFKILFQSHEEGNLDVRFLDLTGLLNDAFTINDLAKCLKRVLPHVTEGLESLSIEDSNSDGKPKVTFDVADSWEDEIDDEATPDTVLPAQLTTPHFTNLTRLSLAHPSPLASWPDLLKMSVNLHKLTHLSLAYWPRPTLTPNAATTSMQSNVSRVALGGTSYYSDLDDDWHEAANILRRFSINTYSLQWLDLEGCPWIRALTWRPPPPISIPSVTPTPYHTPHGWYDNPSAPGPDWNDAWQRITYLHIFQGWIPADNKSLQNMPAGIVPVQLMRWLRENQERGDVAWKLNAGERGQVVGEWVDREKMGRGVGMEIQGVRRGREGLWCRVDYGWGGDGERDE